MKKLADFSIETDNVVWLKYQDGQDERVAVWQLARRLVDEDARRVRAALKLRQNFIRTHIPKLGVAVVLTAGLVGALVGGGSAVAHLLAPPLPAAGVPGQEAGAHLSSAPPIVVVAPPTGSDTMQPSAPAIMTPAPVSAAAAGAPAASSAAVPQPALQAAPPLISPSPAAPVTTPVPSRPLRVLGLSLDLGGLLGGK